MKKVLLFAILLLLSAQSASALTLADLRYRASLTLGRDTSSARTQHWTNLELNAWINDAIRYVSQVSLCLRRDTVFVLDTGKTDYTMPVDYIKLDGVVIGSKGPSRDQDRSPLGGKVVIPSSLGRTVSTRLSPDQWQDRGEIVRQIRCSPSPIIRDTVRVTYYAYGRQLTQDTMECNLPTSFQFALPDYVASAAWGRMRSPDLYWERFVARLSVLVPSIQQSNDPPVKESTAGPNQ